LQKGRKKGSDYLDYSFALEKLLPENPTELQRTVFFFEKSDYRIHIIKEDFIGFAEQLRERFGQDSSGITSRVEEARKPEVFICHANEDKDYAASLYKKLEQAGIRPWLDKEKLRGGDRWDNIIKNTIEEIDYFVVMQSKNLEEKCIGYVNKEIRLALEREKKFRDLNFIIPVKIDESKLLKELEPFQAIDLTDKANIKKLIDTIQRDFEKRKNR
jgi:hypothetical protein